jgi:hypothetical protein
MSEHWIATLGAPRGHRIRFAESTSGATNIRRIECECGWSLEYNQDEPSRLATDAHAKHCDEHRAGVELFVTKVIEAEERERLFVTKVIEAEERERLTYAGQLDEAAPHAAESES